MLIALPLFSGAGKVEAKASTDGGSGAPAKSKAKTASSADTAPARTADSEDGVLLTVSGYVIPRERIELSPRFMGMVKWIGVKKGDPVTNNQVVVLLDDAGLLFPTADSISMISESVITGKPVGIVPVELDTLGRFLLTKLVGGGFRVGGSVGSAGEAPLEGERAEVVSRAAHRRSGAVAPPPGARTGPGPSPIGRSGAVPGGEFRRSPGLRSRSGSR